MRAVEARVALPSGSSVLGIRMGEVDRFLVPLDDPAIIHWFFDHLFVAHNLRERLRVLSVSPSRVSRGGCAGFDRCWTLEAPLVGRCTACGALHAPDGGWSAVLQTAGSAAEQALLRRGDARLEAHPSRCIFLRDYPSSRRGTVLLFVFPRGRRRPAAVVKVRPAIGDPTPLREEWLALTRSRRRLPPVLRGRVPKPLSFDTIDGLDVLVMSSLAGRSAYVELYQGLEPARVVARHFTAAAEWLAEFHDATRSPGRSYLPAADPALGQLLEAEPQGARWYEQLCELSVHRPAFLSAGHGDFWARNLVLPSDPAGAGLHAAGVVDWEHGSVEASPFHDLLQFPLTYAMDYPWTRFRRRPLADAFRLTFLERNCVSQAVREYLGQYCSRTSLDPALLLPVTHLQLLLRARDAPPARRAQWLGCQKLLEQAETSVFSL